MSGAFAKLDAYAEKLQAKANEVLKSTSSNVSSDDEGGEKSGGKREAIRNVAKIVKEQAGKGLGTSKEYLTKVVEQVSTYTTEATTTASTQLAGAKEKGMTQLESAKETATTQLASAKEVASTHIAGIQTNLNKAVAQGQAQGSASSTTDRDLPADTEPLSFPFNVIAWIVSVCGWKSSTPSASETSTSKDFSVESLQNAAATLADSLVEGAHSISRDAQASGNAALKSVGEKVEAAGEA